MNCFFFCGGGGGGDSEGKNVSPNPLGRITPYSEMFSYILLSCFVVYSFVNRKVPGFELCLTVTVDRMKCKFVYL